MENLLGDFEFEVQVPYLLYRNASQEVSGIWFYNSCECEEVANLFSRYLPCFISMLDFTMIHVNLLFPYSDLEMLFLLQDNECVFKGSSESKRTLQQKVMCSLMFEH